MKKFLALFLSIAIIFVMLPTIRLTSQAASTTDWVPASDAPEWAVITDRKYTYTLREYTSSAESSLSGWEKYDTKQTSWTAWSGWDTWNPSDGVRNVEYRSQYIKTQYHYYRWRNSNYTAVYSYPNSGAGCSILEERWFDYVLPNSAGFTAVGYDGVDKVANQWIRADYAGNHSYVSSTWSRDVYQDQWRYQNPVYTYYYYRDLSQESADDPSGLNNVSNVKEWVRYRNDTCQLYVNVMFDDEMFYKGMDGCTFDVYINGTMVADDCTLFCESYTYGSQYTISDMKAPVGAGFSGTVSGSLTGTINQSTEVCLHYETLTYSDYATFNGNVYYLYNTYSACSWQDAQTFCESKGGYLATVTSEEEMAAIAPLLTNNTWLGATDNALEGTWEWVTGESFSYTNWKDGEPNNKNGSENYLHAYPSAENYTWNDTSTQLNSFILETSQQTPDAPADVVCFNGHFYELYTFSMSWDAAKKFCEEKRSGHLLTINDAAEQAFIEESLLSDIKGAYYIGASDATSEGTFEWITDEPFVYSNWATGEPNDLNVQDYLQIYSDGKWADDANNISSTRGFICEIDNPDQLSIIYGLQGSDLENFAAGNNNTFIAIGTHEELDEYSYDYTPGVGKLVLYGNGRLPENLGENSVWRNNAQLLRKVIFTDNITYIGKNALENCSNVNSVVFPYSLENIGSNALEDTQWYRNQPDGLVMVRSILYSYKDAPEENNIILNTGVTHISGNFSQSLRETEKSPESIQISNTVVGIDDGALSYALNLKTLTVHQGNTAYKTINNILYSKDGSQLVCYPAGLNGEISIPNTVKTINPYAFAGCASLTEITLGKNITAIGEHAFDDTSLHTIYGYAGSYAEQYAKEYGYVFVPHISTVTFDYNDENGTTKQITVNTGTAIGDLYVPGMEDYEFVGWFLETDAEDMCISENFIVNEDITLYAYWDAIEEETPYITAISVQSLPHKQSYFTGDLLDMQGLTVTAIYSNGETRVLSKGFSCAPAVLNISGTQKINVMYAGFADSFNVTVVDVVPTSLTLTNMPATLTYFVSSGNDEDSTFTPKGLVGMVIYNNGTRQLIRDPSAFEYYYDFSEATNSTNITVNYCEKDTVVSAFYQVRVLEKPKVYSKTINAENGQEIAIPVYISNNIGIMGYCLELSFDPSVLIPENISKGINKGELTWDKGYGEKDKIKVFWMDSEEYTDDGLLFVAYFKVNATANQTQTTVEISELTDDTFNARYENVQFACTAATVNITQKAVPTLYSYDTSVEAGTYIDVPIVVKNDIGIADMTIITLSYDTNVFTYVSITEMTSEIYRVSNQNGKVKISLKESAAFNEEHSLFSVRFLISEEATGTCTIDIEADDDRWTCNHAEIEIVESTLYINVSVQNTFAVLGNEVEIPVTVENNRGLMGWHFALQFDSSVFALHNIEPNDQWEGLFDYNETSPGTVEVIWSGAGSIKADGTIFILCLNTIGIPTEKETLVSLDYLSENTYNEEWKSIAITCNSAVVRIQENCDVHDFSVLEKDETHHWNKCSVCGKTTEKSVHSGNKTDCTKKAECEVCGMAYGETFEHDYVNHEAKAVSCTAAGWDAYVSCSKCDYTTYVEIPAPGHEWSEWTVSIPATAEKEGEEFRTCGKCQEKESRVIEKTDPSVGIIIPADCTFAKESADGLAVVNSNTTVAVLLAATNATAVLTENGETADSAEKISTGMQIVLIKDATVSDRMTVVVPGDTNGDGLLTAGDARIALRISVGLDGPEGAYLAAAKVNGGTFITAGDARSILRASVGLDDPLAWFGNYSE